MFVTCFVASCAQLLPNVLQQELLASQPTGDTEKDRERQEQIDELRERERIRKEKISAYNKMRNSRKKLVRFMLFDVCFFGVVVAYIGFCIVRMHA